jgi:NADH:ubiquinone oxidoreductase subunit E
MSGFTDTDRRKAEAAIARYPHSKSALLPLLHIAQDRDGWVTPDAMKEIAEMLGLTPALVLGTCSFYTMLKREPVGRLIVSVCTNVSCLVNGGPELLEHLRAQYADDADVHIEEVECIAACDLAPVMQVNYEFHGPAQTWGWRT